VAGVEPRSRTDPRFRQLGVREDRSAALPTIQALLDQGEATRGFTVKVRGGHLILGRVDELGSDQRYRLTPLGAGHFSLSLYDRNRWEPLPYEGTLNEMVDVMNSDLAHWAADWSLPPR
jgi:hypothetical protein